MITLRPIDQSDSPLYNSLMLNKEIVDLLGRNYTYSTTTLSPQSNAVRCTIMRDNDAAGFVSLTNIESTNRSAEFSIVLDPQFHHQGIGTIATHFMLSHGFNDLNLHRIYLKVLESNTIAQSLYKKCGFTLESTERESIYKAGKYNSNQVYSILKTDKTPEPMFILSKMLKATNEK